MGDVVREGPRDNPWATCEDEKKRLRTAENGCPDAHEGHAKNTVSTCRVCLVRAISGAYNQGRKDGKVEGRREAFQEAELRKD